RLSGGQLRAGARPPLVRPRRSGWGHGFDGFTLCLAGRALPDDLLEVVVALDLFLEIAILLLQLGAETSDLLVRAHVLDGEGDLFRNFFEHGYVLGRVPIECEALQQQCPDRSSPRREGNAHVRANSTGDHDL